jgi:CDP-6-deoxy-D-xylo-4-hexulose-3-dehydrase
MSDKKDKILKLIKEYYEDELDTPWVAGKDWIEYSGPNYGADEYLAAVKSLLSGWLIFGKSCREFELEFSEYLGQEFGALTNSGSSANLLMAAAAKSKNGLNLPFGSKIITPVVCFPTTVNPLLQNGFEPVFVDVDLPGLNLNLDEVEKVLIQDPSIAGICFAHVLGNPPDMDRLMSLVSKYGLVFLEDSCDALGSTYDGKKLGSFGDISTCSFFPAHHMTLGEGGFVATNSRKLRKTIASLRDWGRACYCNSAKPGNVTGGTACGDRFQEWLPGLPDVTYDHRYVFDEIGYNLKPLDLQGAMGLEQLKKLPEMDAARRKNHKTLNSIFKKYEKWFHLPVATEKSDPCWFAYLLTVKDDAPFTREEFVNFMERRKIQTRSYFSGNILYHPGYNNLAKGLDLEALYPVARKVTTDSFFLGTFIGLTDEKMKYIESAVGDFFDRRLEV